MKLDELIIGKEYLLENKKVFYCGLYDGREDTLVIEFSHADKTGWRRSGSVPKDYVSKGSDLYYCVGVEDLSEIISNKTDNKPLFEVGKWYKLDNWICKFKEVDEDRFYGYNIDTISKFIDKCGWLSLDKFIPVLITDLNEIQQYLPEGHPDKIVKEEVKPIEKWSIGSYVVFCKDEVLGINCKIGDIDIIVNKPNKYNCVCLKKFLSCDVGREDSGEIKWFATLKEAEEFSKSLKEKPMEKEFILPENWHVVVTEENQEVLSRWRFDNSTYKLDVGEITGMYRGGIIGHNPATSREGFGDEITFDQFKQYVLKEPIVEKSTIQKEELIQSPWKLQDNACFHCKYHGRCKEVPNYNGPCKASGGQYYAPDVKPMEQSIEKDWSKSTKEELLEEAKRRYPIGVKVKTVNGLEIIIFYSLCAIIRNSIIEIHQNIVGGCLYSQGKWAEIIELPETIVESKEVIPEYVEYIDSSDIGKIVKVLQWTPNSYCIVQFDNGALKEPFKHILRPSTKEAYDVQNKPKQSISDQKQIPERLSFYVKYCEEFTEDLFDAFMEYSKKNCNGKIRGFDDSYSGLKKHGYFLFDNWNIGRDNCYGKNNYMYGVDNNSQFCKECYSIKQLKELIGYSKSDNSKCLVGRYIKALIDHPSGGDVKKDDIGKITDNYNGYLSIDFPSHKNYCVKNDISKFHGRYELLSIDYDPEHKLLSNLRTVQFDWDAPKYYINEMGRSVTYSDSVIPEIPETSIRLQRSQLVIPIEADDYEIKPVSNKQNFIIPIDVE